MEFNDEQRLATLHAHGILDTTPDPALDELTAFAASLFGAPTALVSLVDRDRLWFASRSGMTLREAPRTDAFCDTTIRTGRVLVVPDAKADPHYATSPLVDGPPGIRFYARPLDAKRHDRNICLCNWIVRVGDYDSGRPKKALPRYGCRNRRYGSTA